MASIRKRIWKTDGGALREAWQVDFIDQHGKRHQPQFARRSQADAWLVEARTQVKAGTYTPDATSATVTDAVDLWLDRALAEGLERGTRQQYRQHRDHMLAAIDGRTKLSRLTQARCEQVRDNLLRTHSRDMARRVLQSFRSVIRDAKRRGLTAQNVAAETTINGAKRHKRKLKVGVDVPLPTEIKALIETAEPKARAAVCLAALAGLRASELRALPWGSIAFGDKPTVAVEQRADKWLVIGSPKSEASRRVIPIGEATVQALRAWRLAQPAGRTLVFGTASDRPSTLDNLQKRLLTPLCAAAGVPRYSWHALRHYAISAWLRSCGGNFKLVQCWAGHSALTLTLDTYGHLIPRPDDHNLIAAAEQDIG